MPKTRTCTPTLARGQMASLGAPITNQGDPVRGGSPRDRAARPPWTTITSLSTEMSALTHTTSGPAVTQAVASLRSSRSAGPPLPGRSKLPLGAPPPRNDFDGGHRPIPDPGGSGNGPVLSIWSTAGVQVGGWHPWAKGVVPWTLFSRAVCEPQWPGHCCSED